MSDTDELPRDLGLFLALMIGVGTMVGAGIFVLAGATTADAGPAATAAFVLGGVIGLFTAATASELSTAMPKRVERTSTLTVHLVQWPAR